MRGDVNDILTNITRGQLLYMGKLCEQSFRVSYYIWESYVNNHLGSIIIYGKVM